MTYTAVIKGQPWAAYSEAHKRGIAFDFLRMVKGDTVIRVREEYFLPLAAWMAESPAIIPGEGFPPGTCLIYSEHRS